MWEILDFRDKTLVRLAQRELWREADMRRLARTVTPPRRSVLGVVASRFGPHRLTRAGEAA
jgi:hypothetical protein